MPQVGVGEHVEALELDALRLHDLDDRVAESALWALGHALHVDDHLVCVDVLLDLRMDIRSLVGVRTFRLGLEIVVNAV